MGRVRVMVMVRVRVRVRARTRVSKREAATTARCVNEPDRS